MTASTLIWGGLHTFLVVALAPFITGIARLTKARLQGRIGASPFQPYRDLYRLMQKETVVPDTASPLFLIAPYLVFVSVWLAATIMPTFTTDVALARVADLIALIALLGFARFMTALAGLDAGTSFGGLGASREMFIASLAEPAMLMSIFTLSLIAGTTSPSTMALFVQSGMIGLSVSMGLSLGALLMVAISETGRIPIDNPSTHLELTMIHEAMVLEYSGRPLALMEGAAMVRLMLFMSIISSLFFPWGLAGAGSPAPDILIALAVWIGKLLALAVILGFFETVIAKLRLFRVSDFLGGALLLAWLGAIFLYVSEAV